MVFLIIALIYAIIYVWLLLYIRKKWLLLPDVKYTAEGESNSLISIIIAAKNEADHIQQCLKSIQNNKYPNHLYEIIVVDDHSTDKTGTLALNCSISNLKVINLPDGLSGKKAALHEGIKASGGEILVFTDADCTVPENWLSIIVSVFENDSVIMVSGPVMTSGSSKLIEKFQQLDYAATMGITAVALDNGIFPLANGANMAYRKSFYEESGSMHSHIQIASGDDIFMAEKVFANNVGGLIFLKSHEAVVYTKSETDLSTLMQQRKRWAGKAKHYKYKKMNMLHSFIFGYCSLVLLSLIIGIVSDEIYLLLTLFMLLFKFCVDYFYLQVMVRWFGCDKALVHYPFSAFLYFLHIFHSGWWAIFSNGESINKPTWK